MAADPLPAWRAWPRSGIRATRCWRGLLAALVVVVGWLALQPHPPAAISLGWDKLNHASAFAAMGFSAWLAYPGPAKRRAGVQLALLAYGGLIELLQTALPPRQGELADLLADAVGLMVGAALAALACRALLRAP